MRLRFLDHSVKPDYVELARTDAYVEPVVDNVVM
jgi:hypothetical protein